MYKELTAAATVAHDGHLITQWRCKSIRARIKFLFTGKIHIVERSFKSTKLVTIGDPLAIVN